MRGSICVALLGCALALVAAQRLSHQDAEVERFEDPSELIQEDDTNAGGTNGAIDTGSTHTVSHGPASGGVDSVVPEFQDKEEWEHADAFMRNSFNHANEHYQKINAAEYKAQGERRVELAHKAEVALKALIHAKEVIQKKYAKDDPSDFGKHENTADKADEKRYKVTPVKLGGSGTWGASGTPNKLKWYSDGVISTDGWVDTKGHYLLGAHRRRVGAGFARRRGSTDIGSAGESPSGNQVKAIEKGHPLLAAAFGDPKKVDEKKAEDKAAVPKLLKDAGIKVIHSETKTAKTATSHATAGTTAGTKTTAKAVVAKKVLTVAEVEAAKDAALAKKGLVEPHKESLTAENKATLHKTNAGVQPVMDTVGHLTKAVDVRIVGSAITKEIAGPGHAEAAMAN